MENSVTLEQALTLARQLSPADKARLIERIVPDIERELETGRPVPRKSLRGLWRGLGITEEDIAEARREMWGDFPSVRCFHGLRPPRHPGIYLAVPHGRRSGRRTLGQWWLGDLRSSS